MDNQLKIGVLLSYVNIFVTLLRGLLYTPILLRLLGQSEYGLYSLIGSLIVYFSMLDLVLGTAIVRYTAKNRAIGDKNSEANLNGMFLSLYVVIGLLTVIVGTVLYDNLDNLFYAALTNEELSKAKLMTALLIFNFAISFPLSVFSSLMQAYERFVFLRLCNICRDVLHPMVVLPLLYMGYGSVMIVAIFTILNIGCLLLHVYYCFRYLHISFRFTSFDFVLLKEIAVYSFFVFLNVVTDRVYWSTGQFILGMISGTSVVAIYAVAMQFVMIYNAFSTAISGILLPKVTMMTANKASNTELSALMIRIGRLQYIVIGYIFAMFVLCGRMFLYLWAGAAYEEAYIVIVMILLVISFPLIQNTGITILRAKNLNKFIMTVYAIAAFINVLISIPLAKQYGGLGCAAAIAGVQLVANVFITNTYYYYKIGLDMPLFWKSMMRMSLPILILLIVGFLMSPLFNEYTWTNMLLQSGVFSLVYIVAMFFVGMNQYEKGLLQKLFIALYEKIRL
ncbi:oligosaccharide flippase family protein [Sporomusa sp. GT1]|uniref:oligosaccharide flippase family protein n=1 Tax=Sporomusa sp. GT1 TaxID=1534747 RepID=UPI00166439EA|nr:oligosaccharide flippase family protein [Sporomusa sp. GT1]